MVIRIWAEKDMSLSNSVPLWQTENFTNALLFVTGFVTDKCCVRQFGHVINRDPHKRAPANGSNKRWWCSWCLYFFIWKKKKKKKSFIHNLISNIYAYFLCSIPILSQRFPDTQLVYIVQVYPNGSQNKNLYAVDTGKNGVNNLENTQWICFPFCHFDL